MQLRSSIAILWRYWYILVGLPALVAAISAATALTQPPRYTSQARIMVTLAPLAAPATTPNGENLPDFNNNYSWLTSEYVLDDIPAVVTSRTFGEDVSTILAGDGRDVVPQLVQSSLFAEHTHRTVTLEAVTDDPALAPDLIDGSIRALQAYGLKYWNRPAEEGTGLSIAILDPVSDPLPTVSRRDMALGVVIRTALAAAAAVGIVFLLHYLDDRVRNRQQAEAWLELPIVATIPREQRS